MPVMSNGIVMNGPTPIMLVMLRAVACRSENLRGSLEVSEIIGVNGEIKHGETELTEIYFPPSPPPALDRPLPLPF
jgi:hypothetical protein